MSNLLFSMNRFVLFFLISIITSLSSFSQSSVKYWSDGKLTWNDFNEASYPSFKFLFELKRSKEKVGQTNIIREYIVCFIDKTLLQIPEERMNDQTLRYFQVIFDIGELQARAITKEQDIKPYQIASQTIPLLGEKFSKMIMDFEIESNYGEDLEVIEEWEIKVDKVLASYKKEEIPIYTLGNFGYGMFTGGGIFSLSKGLGSNYGNGGLFTFGFEGTISKSYITANINIGGTRSIAESNSTTPWRNGQKLSIAYAMLSYGYPLVDKNKVRVIPNLGVGVLEFSEKGNDDDRVSKARAVPYVGVNVDFKLKNTLNFVGGSFLTGREKTELYLRTSLGVSSAKFNTLVSGNIFHLNVLVGMKGNKINPKY